MKRTYILYDGRAMLDIDRATMVEICHSRQEAYRRSKGYDYVCYSYIVKRDGSYIDEKYEFTRRQTVGKRKERRVKN